MKNTLQFPQSVSCSIRMISLTLLTLSLAVRAQSQTFSESGPSKVNQLAELTASDSGGSGDLRRVHCDERRYHRSGRPIRARYRCGLRLCEARDRMGEHDSDSGTHSL